MKKLIALLSFTVLGLSAQANSGLPIWACTMHFDGIGKGVQVIVGSYKFSGHGKLHCINPLTEVKTIPVKVEMKAFPISPTVAFGKMHIYGQTGEIALFANEPEDLLGKYLVVEGQAAVVGGIGVITAAKIGFPEIAIVMSLQFTTGFGVNLGLTKMIISAE